jgi:hypothetical protein
MTRFPATLTVLEPHLREQWVIPPAANAAFVAAMEAILTVYARPRDPDRPLVCLDETSKRLIRETRTPVPMRRCQPARVDDEYERNGTANFFMLFAPLEGWRHVEVTDHRAAADYAAILRELSDRPDKDAPVGEISAWEAARNKHHANADWQFTTAGARVKLNRLYPSP